MCPASRPSVIDFWCGAQRELVFRHALEHLARHGHLVVELREQCVLDCHAGVSFLEIGSRPSCYIRCRRTASCCAGTEASATWKQAAGSRPSAVSCQLSANGWVPYVAEGLQPLWSQHATAAGSRRSRAGAGHSPVPDPCPDPRSPIPIPRPPRSRSPIPVPPTPLPDPRSPIPLSLDSTRPEPAEYRRPPRPGFATRPPPGAPSVTGEVTMDSDPTQEPGVPPASGRPRSAASRTGTPPSKVPSPEPTRPRCVAHSRSASSAARAPPLARRAGTGQHARVADLAAVARRRLAVLGRDASSPRACSTGSGAARLAALCDRCRHPRLQRRAPLGLFDGSAGRGADGMIAFEWFARIADRPRLGGDDGAHRRSGGVESPATIFFLFHISIASLLLPHRHFFLFVTLAPLLVGIVAALEYRGRPSLTSRSSTPPDGTAIPLYVSAVLAFFTAACYVDGLLLHGDRAAAPAAGDRTRRALRQRARRDLDARDHRGARSNRRSRGARARLPRRGDPTDRSNRVPGGVRGELGAERGLPDEVPEEYARSRLDQESIAARRVLHVR